jgi:hypothetical protein
MQHAFHLSWLGSSQHAVDELVKPFRSSWPTRLSATRYLLFTKLPSQPLKQHINVVHLLSVLFNLKVCRDRVATKAWLKKEQQKYVNQSAGRAWPEQEQPMYVTFKPTMSSSFWLSAHHRPGCLASQQPFTMHDSAANILAKPKRSVESSQTKSLTLFRIETRVRSDR